ncbi:hypothetical protein BW723_04355 [Polaribacter reichenbachii]|uniref:Fibronectin type-III domain-containing protein n=2 Tax=Polaribacter reichenbachii TaxID=996801 RepID=A0A1B8TV20_9FLAO|nr:hypothetical protein BW723_04355 [Polaribacter reichenbachii]AUC19435.1 hypothetical protein BTO17_12360 [Polaribacter reichenbachii]OBY63410.1 hypothetical protein LPB301_11355 [Polaribacter reichenbachii]
MVNSQIVLLRENAPYDNVNDGDFNAVRGYWRQAKQSPFWKTKVIFGKEKMGLHNGSLFSMNKKGIADSKLLNTNSNYKKHKEGEIINWEFGADLEYISNGTISLSLVFGDIEKILANKVQLVGSDKKIEHFKGTYVITKQDAKAGLPFVRATFYSEKDVKVYLHYVNISVKNNETQGPNLLVDVVDNGILLKWNKFKKALYNVYRSTANKTDYKKIGTTNYNAFIDSTFITGVNYNYVVTRIQNDKESSGSNIVSAVKKDKIKPKPPTQLKAEIYDTELKIFWKKSIDKDVSHYAVYRGDATGNNLREIAHNLKRNYYLDFTPLKNTNNSYVVYAYDFSGNKSKVSDKLIAKVKTVQGTSFSDLILPMPIHQNLSSNVWGGKTVIPRDINNGIEAKDWSYWGGRPVKDTDNKYHMNITRWPANATKGHWEWPNSTVAHVVANKPTGSYKVKDSLVYSYANGLGHNPDIILLNDGTYLMYSLINWEANLFKSASMNGPWQRLGVMEVDLSKSLEKPSLNYRYFRNLSGVQLDDDRFLFVTKGGGMMISKDKNPLGPYTPLTTGVRGNKIIPIKYRNSNYEDPVLWKDEVQYHMIINAFLDYRAIYLRSIDGINWKFNLGTAYTPDITSYADKTRTHWYKLERPHVLQDNYGRATHLSLAVIDVPKADDLANDNHNSKNIIIPLVVQKRISILNKTKVNQETKNITIIIHSEKGFNAQTDINVNSLRFGATEEVDFGRGCKVLSTKKKGKGLLVEFSGIGNGITENNFVCKLLGSTKKGNLIIAYSKLKTN